ncbi:DUF4240 domain-containing protein [Micromonospora azadirachtae]|uniref:DUF4240 domain-containing protein n=1 Tax=Micromonospora azadirachtae TaxID=1970735 RepID=A0ABW2ZVC4_9ACTN
MGGLLAHRRGARGEVGSDTELVAQALLRRLRALPPDEIDQFEELWFQAQDELYRWPIRDSATLLLDSIDGDEFFAVQNWIVSHGRSTLQRVQGDPDSLVELAPDRHNARIDWFCGLPLDAYIAVTGAPSAIDGPSGPGAPVGTPAELNDETSTRQRLPRLTTYLDINP